MNRKEFLKWCVGGVAGFTVLPDATASVLNGSLLAPGSGNSRKKGKIRFGICADVHQDFFPGVPQRMQKFVHEMNRERVDFIIQLGDFCLPKPENRPFMEIWEEFDGPRYPVLGNHDTQISNKQAAMDFIGFPSKESYYSFDLGNYHFVALDLNFGMNDGKIVPYDHDHGPKTSPCNMMSDEELDWLEADLKATRKKTLLFSHQTLNEELANKERFDEIIRQANRKSPKVIAAFSGHDHSDWVKKKEQVWHCQINSLSYFWAGGEYADRTRYPEETYKKYPILSSMIPYRDALYAIVELDPDEKSIRITGKQSTFIAPGPSEVNYPNPETVHPCISDRLLTYK